MSQKPHDHLCWRRPEHARFSPPVTHPDPCRKIPTAWACFTINPGRFSVSRSGDKALAVCVLSLSRHAQRILEWLTTPVRTQYAIAVACQPLSSLFLPHDCRQPIINFRSSCASRSIIDSKTDSQLSSRTLLESIMLLHICATATLV